MPERAPQDRAGPDRVAVRAPVPEISRRHLDVLSDGIAIMQHAIGSRPDPAHGYCTDDVARALQVDLLHSRTLGWPAVAGSARRNIEFLVAAFDWTTGRFRNFRHSDGSWVEESGSEDCQGRAFHALGDFIAAAPDDELTAKAAALFERALRTAAGLTALRARASVLLGLAAKLRAAPDPGTAWAFRDLATEFHLTFRPATTAAWPWPEDTLTYENALPARALVVAGQAVGSATMVEAGLLLLDWLIGAQTAAAGHLSPIGNGWWEHGGRKAQFDQQPIEATTLIVAAEAALAATGEARYRAAMERAYGWFLGENDLGLAIAQPLSGASFDGLSASGVNTNQGAESTLMWLMAAEHIRALRATEPALTRVAGPQTVGAHRRFAMAGA